MINLISERLQSVVLSIHTNNECGGWDAYIEIFYNDYETCKTKPWSSFEKGATLIRVMDDLGSCEEKFFDTTAEEIKFRVKTSHSGPFENDDFCPKKLEFQFKISGRKYESDIMNEWVDLNKNSDLIRTAKLKQKTS